MAHLDDLLNQGVEQYGKPFTDLAYSVARARLVIKLLHDDEVPERSVKFIQGTLDLLLSQIAHLHEIDADNEKTATQLSAFTTQLIEAAVTAPAEG